MKKINIFYLNVINTRLMKERWQYAKNLGNIQLA